eukprot:jgi/Mesen1/1088/ME000123S00253
MKDLVFTLGHSTRASDEFVEILQSCNATFLYDIRTVPKSKRNPQFNRDVLPDVLSAATIKYKHQKDLGGLRKARKDSINTGWHNESFRGYADYMQDEKFALALKELVEEVESGEVIVLMCAEVLPWRCHRSLVSDALTARGYEVRHLMGKGKVQTHRVTPFACVQGTSVTYPSQKNEAIVKASHSSGSSGADDAPKEKVLVKKQKTLEDAFRRQTTKEKDDSGVM